MPPPFEDWRWALCFAPVRTYVRVSVRPPMQLLLRHVTDIHETYSQYLP